MNQESQKQNDFNDSIIKDDYHPIRDWTIYLLISCIMHVGFFYGASVIVNIVSASYELKIAWSDEPLTGFGMMGAFDELDYDETKAIEEELTKLDEDLDDPQEEPEFESEPELNPDSIEAPPEPEVEVQPDAVPDPDAPAPKKKSKNLADDPERLAAIRNDVSGMPNLHVLAPGNAKLIVLLRNDRIQGSRFEQSVRKLFKSFPDYRFTLGTSDVDPIADINAMLIATSNPQLYADTFLVVSHKIPFDTLKKAISDSFPTKINWETYENHPIATPDSTDGRYNPRAGIYKRSVYLPSDNTILFLRPEVLPSLNVPHIDSIVAKRDNDTDTPEQAQTFLQSLGAIQTSDSPSMPMLFLALQGIEDIQLGPGFPEFPPPTFIQASISTDANPRLNLVAAFDSDENAQKFNDLWPDILKAASSLGVPGLGSILGGLATTADKSQVIISGDLNGNMISLILMFASSHLNRA